jgi:hypothetical protein
MCVYHLQRCRDQVTATRARLQKILQKIKQAEHAPLALGNSKTTSSTKKKKNVCDPHARSGGCNVCGDCCASFIPMGNDCDRCVQHRCYGQGRGQRHVKTVPKDGGLWSRSVESALASTQGYASYERQERKPKESKKSKGSRK